MEKLELELDELLLDLENPRIGFASNQSEALESIVELDRSHFRNMMRSIKEHGLDPGDSFYVLQSDEEEGAYVVVDGNRRLAALKVLANPIVLQGTKLGVNIIKQISKVAEGFQVEATKILSAVLFDNRDEANDWIMRRHGRSMDGEGRIAWGPLEIDRFRKERTTLDVIEFVERNANFTEEVWTQIRHSVESSSNVLRRLIDSRRGREWLGLTVKNIDGAKIPYFDQKPEYVITLLSQIFADINAGRVDTRSLNKTSDIEDYFDALPDNLHPSGASRAEPQSFKGAVVSGAAIRAKPSTTTSPKAKTGKTVAIAPPRPTLAPMKHPFVPPASEKGRQLLREAAKIRLRDFPLASAYILRSVLEHTIDVYMTNAKIPFFENNKRLELKLRADRVIQHLVRNKVAEMINIRYPQPRY